MFQNGQKVVVVSSGDPARVIKVQAVTDGDASRYPIVDTTGVAGRDQSVQIVSGGDPTRFPQLRGLATARDTADSVISALTPVAWYRNATGVTSAGGFASQWDDYSGNGRHLVQATGTNQPAYAAGVFTFDGADNFMASGAFTLNQGFSVFIVVKQNAYTAGDRIYTIGGDFAVFLEQQTATPNLRTLAGSYSSENTNLAVNSYGIVGAVYNGASSSLIVNETAAVTGDFGANNGGAISIGARLASGLNAGAISVKEAVFFGSALSDVNRAAVITALNNALTVF